MLIEIQWMNDGEEDNQLIEIVEDRELCSETISNMIYSYRTESPLNNTLDKISKHLIRMGYNVRKIEYSPDIIIQL